MTTDVLNIFSSVFNDGPSHDKVDNWRDSKVKIRAQASDFVLINFFQKYGNSFFRNPPMFGCREFSSNITDNRQKYKLLMYLDDNQQYKMLGRKQMYTGLLKEFN